MKAIRTWWQQRTGEEETPFDGDAPVWVVSMVFHLALMVLLAFITIGEQQKAGLPPVVALPMDELEEEPEMAEIDEIYFNEQPSEEVGANSNEGEQMAFSEAPVVSIVSDVPSPVEMDAVEDADILINDTIAVATGLNFNENIAVKGAAGEGTTGAVGAVDRLTHEIVRSLEERKTQVVWMFDQSGSLTRQRTAIHDRFDRIYEELGVLEAANNPAFAKYKDKPLLSTVVAFGDKVTLRTEEEGTDNVEEIKNAVKGIETDETGVERVFSAIHMAAAKYKHLRVPNKDGEVERNVLIVVFTDEMGDDYKTGLDPTIGICRRYEIPVHVVGVPAPFGQRVTHVKWVDPDPEYSQAPQWGEVNQGPESFMPERLRLSFSGFDEQKNPIDSGFGPFALTRLAYETGGIYFTVHPNRNVNREVSRRETEAFSAHISHFFDPEVMRRYRPDYVSGNEYARRLKANKSRSALVQAAQFSQVGEFTDVETRFEKLDEARFVNSINEAQKNSAKLGPKLDVLYNALKMGETDRAKETSPRWQAGYDLAIGRVLAVKVRTESYNAMLASAKSSLRFKDPKNNTWVLEGADEVDVNSRLEKMGAKAKEYLTRVVQDHPGTPWAFLAQRELDNPLSYKWKEEYTKPPEPRAMNAGNNNNNAAAANDKKRMLKRAPTRKLPKL